MCLVSVIIVNYNGGYLIMDAVDAISRSNASSQLVVSDNGSLDGSFHFLKQYLEASAREYPSRYKVDTISLENGQNLGFAVANNVAIKRSSGRYVLLLNPDCIVQADTVTRMLEVMESDPSIGMAGCRILNEDGTEQAGCRRNLPTATSGLLRAFNLRKVRTENPVDLCDQVLPDGPVEVEAISGAFMLLRRSAIDDVGLMDESYFLHCEDLDYCKRFHEKGWKVMFVPDVTVTHYKGACSVSSPVAVEWHKHQGMVKYFNKFLARDHTLPMRWFVTSGVYARFLTIAGAQLAKRTLSQGRENRAQLPHRVSSIDWIVSREWPKGLLGKRVLVTGATGFIGQQLVDALAGKPSELRILSRNGAETSNLFAEAEAIVHQGDLTDPGTLSDALENIDVIIHLASYSEKLEIADIEESEKHFDVTLRGTENLLYAAQKAGVKKLVFASSVRASANDANCSAYGQAKREAESLLLAQSDIEVSVLRFPVVYGSVVRGNIFKMMVAIDRGRFPRLPEFNDQRSMIHRDDAVKALLLAAQSEKANGKVYLVTDGECYSVRRIYLSIRAALGRTISANAIPKPLLAAAAKAGDLFEKSTGRAFPINTQVMEKLTCSMFYDGSEFKQELDFEPWFNLELALPEMVREYREQQRNKGS